MPLPKFQGVELAATESKSNIWAISSEDLQNYEKVFAHFNKGSDFITDSDMQQVFKMTKCPSDACAAVWELTNPEGEETFTKPMFMSAMHLLYVKKKDTSITLPSSLP